MSLPPMLLSYLAGLFFVAAVAFVAIFLWGQPLYVVRIGKWQVLVTINPNKYRDFIANASRQDESVVENMIFEVKRLHKRKP